MTNARYSQCGDDCTTDCGHCKGNGPPVPLCGMRKPGGTTTCTEKAGHAGPDGKNQSHGDGSVIRWIYRADAWRTVMFREPPPQPKPQPEDQQ